MRNFSDKILCAHWCLPCTHCWCRSAHCYYLFAHSKAKFGGHQFWPVICHTGALFLSFSCVTMGEFLFARKLFRERWSPFAHWHSPFAHWHSVRTATLPKQGSLSTDCLRIDMTMRAKTRKGTASAILMRALLCNRVPVRKQEPLTVIPMRALFQWWKTTHSHCAHWNLICIPVCESYVCPFFMRRMRNFFSVDSQTERKWVPDNARKGTKVTKTGHFSTLRIWGLEKNAPMGITMRG